MFCKNCGAEIADNAAFCPKCGSQTAQTSQQTNPYQGQPNQPYGYQGGYRPQAQNSGGAGKVMLIVGGIIMIIVGIASLASGVRALGLAAFGFGAPLAFEIICAILWLVTGILALVNCGKPEKGGIMMGLGVLLIVLRIIDQIWMSSLANSLTGGLYKIGAGGMIFGIIIAAVVAGGGYLNKNKA